MEHLGLEVSAGSWLTPVVLQGAVRAGVQQETPAPVPADAAGRGGDAASGPTAKDGAEGGRRMMLFPLAMKYRTMKQQVKQGTRLCNLSLSEA